ncbi:MAG: hypothetical protein AAF492_16765 [Verrucomicrobiota bacterium]
MKNDSPRKPGVLNDIFSDPHIVLKLTVILLLLHGATSWNLDVPLRIACGAMLISTTLLTSRVMWLMVCLTLIAGNANDWATIDNHKYVITYWAMACTLAVGRKDDQSILRTNGRYLIAFIFLFATLWKIIAGQYLDGSFLHFAFLTDPRVHLFANYTGGLDESVLPQNRLLKNLIESMPQDMMGVTLESSPRLYTTALISSYWTLLIEGGTALAFLVPRKFRIGQLSDYLLIFFIATTYVLLPVSGFAFVLALMGFAQCPPEKIRLRTTYLILFVIIQLTRLPWQKLLPEWFEQTVFLHALRFTIC